MGGSLWRSRFHCRTARYAQDTGNPLCELASSTRWEPEPNKRFSAIWRGVHASSGLLRPRWFRDCCRPRLCPVGPAQCGGPCMVRLTMSRPAFEPDGACPYSRRSGKDIGHRSWGASPVCADLSKQGHGRSVGPYRGAHRTQRHGDRNCAAARPTPRDSRTRFLDFRR